MSYDKEREFITKELLQRALQNYTKDSKLQVTSYSLTNAIDKGDNYTSEMYRVTVEYSKDNNVNETKSIVIKVAPCETGPRKKLAS